jgi:O-antigen/teichoic acid export membrane protein
VKQDLKSNDSLLIAERRSGRQAASRSGWKISAAPADARVSSAENGGGVWAGLRRIAFGTHALALVDQAVVSGASFLSMIFVSRWAGTTQLGFYSIGISVLISALAVQDSLVSLPYTIQRHNALGTPAEHAGNALAQSALLSTLAIVVLAAAGLALSVNGAKPELVAMTWVLSATVPCALLREFGRRFAFAHLRMDLALMLDVAVAAIQLTALCWLGATGRMSPAVAYGSIGVACALTGIVWLCCSRGNFVIRASQARVATKQSWSLGKWLFAGQVTVSVQNYAAYWLLAFVLGATATGVYAACMSIVSFANPLMTGIGNTLAPRAVLALKEGGRAKLRQEAIRDSLLLGAAMTLFCLVLFFAGQDVMRLFYRGKDFAAHGHTLMVLGLAVLASSVGIPASMGLASMERPQAIIWAGLAGVVLTIVLARCLMIKWGLFGAACGFLAGNVVGVSGLWIAFLAPDSQRDPPVDRAKEQAESPSARRGPNARLGSTDSYVSAK